MTNLFFFLGSWQNQPHAYVGHDFWRATQSAHSRHAVRVTHPCRQPRTSYVFAVTGRSHEIARGHGPPRGITDITQCGGAGRPTQSRATLP